MSSDNNGLYPQLNINAANKCDLFVLGGGELIYPDQICMPTPSPFHFRNHSLSYRLYNRTLFAHLPWVHRIKIPKVILGCGVNADSESQIKPNIIRELENFSYIGLRDKKAVEILKSFPSLKDKVELSYDLAFSLETNGLSWTPSGNSAVVIPTFARGSVDWLSGELSNFDSVTFLPFGQVDNDDFAICRTLSKYAKVSEVLRPEQVTLPLVLDKLVHVRHVYAYRLHGMILSYILGVPFKFYSYHRKLERNYQTLIGQNPGMIKSAQKILLNNVIRCF